MTSSSALDAITHHADVNMALNDESTNYESRTTAVKRAIENGGSPARKQQKNEVPPVLVLNKAKSFENDSALLSKKINEDLEGINIIKCTFTKNGNLLIYPKTPEDYYKIVQSSRKFDDEDIIEIDSNRSKSRKELPQLVVHGLNYANAHQIEDELSSFGVTKIHEIKSLKTKNKALNLIGISCDVNEEKKLLSDGILVNYLHYKVCKYNKPTRLIQCYNCQGFGHYAKTCKEFISRCVVCSEHHEDPKKKCEAITKKCANCGENHTANYSGCNAIKKKLIEIREKESERMLKTKTVYQPSYASKVSNDNQQIILKTINNIEKKLSNIENSKKTRTL